MESLFTTKFEILQCTQLPLPFKKESYFPAMLQDSYLYQLASYLDCCFDNQFIGHYALTDHGSFFVFIEFSSQIDLSLENVPFEKSDLLDNISIDWKLTLTTQNKAEFSEKKQKITERYNLDLLCLQKYSKIVSEATVDLEYGLFNGTIIY